MGESKRSLFDKISSICSVEIPGGLPRGPREVEGRVGEVEGPVTGVGEVEGPVARVGFDFHLRSSDMEEVVM